MSEIALPQDLEGAHALILELTAQVHELKGQADDLKHQLDQMARRMYGRRSEQLDEAQLKLAFAALQAELKELAPAAPPTASPAEKERARGHGRRPLPKHLPREVRVLEPDDDDLMCGCGRAKVRIGEEKSEQLEYVPATCKVIETVRPKYACGRCKEGVTVALAPLRPVQKGLAAPGLLAHVAVSKYVDHLPLARLERIFERLGVPIARQTLCGWVEKIYEVLVAVEAAQWASVLASHVLGADETPVNVLEAGRPQCARGYLWCYVGDRGEVVFDFSMGRGSETPLRALRDRPEGVLQCDAYSGYDVVERTHPRMARAGCMAHARRKVYEAKDTDVERALVVLALFRQLYDVEDAIRAHVEATGADPIATALALRQERSVPVMDRLEELATRYRDEVLPKSPLGKALGYVTNQKDALRVFLSDGAVPIDNNAVEREIRTVAVGRGNWTFIGSEDAGPWAARLYGLLGTCRLQGINPQEWLADVLARVREHPPDRMHELTPRGWRLAREARREGGP